MQLGLPNWIETTYWDSDDETRFQLTSDSDLTMDLVVLLNGGLRLIIKINQFLIKIYKILITLISKSWNLVEMGQIMMKSLSFFNNFPLNFKIFDYNGTYFNQFCSSNADSSYKFWSKIVDVNQSQFDGNLVWIKKLKLIESPWLTILEFYWATKMWAPHGK